MSQPSGGFRGSWRSEAAALDPGPPRMKGGLDEERGAVVPAEIVGLGTAVPPYVLTNADLEQLVDTNDQWITERTGIKERRIAGRGESTSTLGKAAALRALESAGLGVDDVDLLVVATASPDHPLPSASCIL